MRILLIVDCYYPETKSSARLVHDLGMEMRRQGNEVIVLAPSESIRNDMEVSCEEGLLIARVKTGKIKGAAKISRALGEIRLSRTIWKRGRSFLQQHPCDLIVFYSPSIFFGALVRRLKMVWRCPAYLILRDIFPQWALDIGLLRKGPVYNFFRMKELEQYAAADVIGVQSPANLDYFSSSLPGNHYQLEVLYNWTTLSSEDSVVSDYRTQLVLGEKVVFFYGGNIGLAQDMDNILRLASSLQQDSRIFFLFVGDGSETQRVKAAIASRRLGNIRLLPAVRQEEYLAMLAEFDVGLVTLDNKLRTQNFPGKILGYMYHSMPILGSINPGNDLCDLLTEHEAGLCSLNGEDELFRDHALRLVDDATLRERMGHNGRRLLEQYFSVSSSASKILSHFQHSHVFQYADRHSAEIPWGVTLKSRLQ